MKTFCVKHGAHFPEDFFKSLRCGWWESVGLDKLPRSDKRKVWDWLYALPLDEIWIKTHIGISVAIQGVYTPPAAYQTDPKYLKLDDVGRKDFQRRYFKQIQDQLHQAAKGPFRMWIEKLISSLRRAHDRRN